MTITIKRNPMGRCVYQGEKIIATISDQRKYWDRTANWLVCWVNGRVDEHDTYAEARDNALKGL